MGWTIHGTGQHGDMCRSYTSMSNLAAHVGYVVTSKEWRKIRVLFDRPSGDPFSVTPDEAGRAAAILRTAARHRLTPPDWAHAIARLAESAQRAADARQPWKWS